MLSMQLFYYKEKEFRSLLLIHLTFKAHSSLYKVEIMEKMGKQWLDPTELLMQIPIITGGYYYGIGEEGELESVILNEALGIFNR